LPPPEPGCRHRQPPNTSDHHSLAQRSRWSPTRRPLQIADGYHRVCASYHLNQDTEIHCRIADIPAATG
jgi:hypothetical protein